METKGPLFVVGILGILVLLLVILDPERQRGTQTTATTEASALTTPEYVPPDTTDGLPASDPLAEYMDEVHRHLDNLRNGSHQLGEPTSMPEINMELAFFSTYATVVEEADSYSLADSQKALVADLKQRVRQVQRTRFPILRRAYGKMVDKAMWEYDMEVATSGERATRIEFISGMFAANSNIKQINDVVYDMLRQLRFKQSRYRWYKGADEYTYWDLDPEPDDKLVVNRMSN